MCFEIAASALLLSMGQALPMGRLTALAMTMPYQGQFRIKMGILVALRPISGIIRNNLSTSLEKEKVKG